MIFAHLWLSSLRMKQIAIGALTVRCEEWYARHIMQEIFFLKVIGQDAHQTIF